jgi:hypothetical protein
VVNFDQLHQSSLEELSIASNPTRNGFLCGAFRRIKCGTSWKKSLEVVMGFGKGALLWLIGIPLPIIILLALFWHH